MLGEEGDVEAHEQDPELPFPESLVEQTAEHLRPPVEEAGEDREHHAAEERVVEVGDDEVAVVHLPVDRERGEVDAGEPADHEDGEKAERVEHRRVEVEVPAPERREPVEDLDARRHGNRHRRDHEEGVQRVRKPDREHVVRPHEHRDEADPDGRERDRLVAEDRLSREHREHLRDDSERGQHHDVDLGVAEEPERVLPEERRTPLGGVEEVRLDAPAADRDSSVEQEHRQAGGERRQDREQHPREHLDRPHEERHPGPGHPRRPQVVDRHDEVDRSRDRGSGEDVEREDPEVLPVARGLLRERRVARPPRLSCASLREEGKHEDEATEEVQPVRERVQARERDVPCSDHQRNQEVGEAGEDRDEDEEDHRRAVDRHELVVVLGAQYPGVRLRELRAHRKRHEAAEGKEDERGRDVEDPDPLVISGDEPARDPPPLPARHRGLGSSCHWAGAPSGTS